MMEQQMVSSAPLYPVRIVMSEREAAEARPAEVIWVGGYKFARLDRGWALVDHDDDD